MMLTSFRYAWRSLRRSARRTLLSVLGLAFGVGIGLIALSWIGGLDRMSLDAVARGGVGHLRVAPAGWTEHRDDALRLEDGEAVLARIREDEDVTVAAPRSRVSALLGLGNRSAHVVLTGVEPTIEPHATRFVEEVAEGRYLEAGDRGSVVLGGALMERLRAELGDELVVSVVDEHGELRSELLTIVGIVRTGSRTIDRSIAHVTLEDAASLSGHPGIGEIAVLLRDPSDLEGPRQALAAAVRGDDDVITWLDVSDGLRMKIESSGVITDIAVGLILLVVLLGVASAQLTAVLERRKEFAVLAALGMRGASLVRVVVSEGVILGLMGAALALAWTTPILWRWSTQGIDLFSMMPSTGDGLAFSGVLIDRYYYPSFGPWVLSVSIFLSLLATVLASLYPALFAARTDPAEALRVDR